MSFTIMLESETDENQLQSELSCVWRFQKSIQTWL
jgi:hypothetical protein